MSYPKDAEYRASVGWYLDTGTMDAILAAENEGLASRKTLASKSTQLELIGKLHGDMFNQPRLLLNNVDLRVVLSLEKPAFYIMAADTDTSYIQMLDATMYVNHVTLSPKMMLYNEQMLARNITAKYHYQRCEIKTYTIAPGSRTLSLDNLVIGQLPNLLIFGMVDNDAYTGKRSLNPFNFKHNHMSTCQLMVNGVSTPAEPLKFDFYNEPPRCARAYNYLFRNLNMWSDGGHQVTQKFFVKGSFLLAFDLTADASYNTSSCGNLINTGVVRLEATFDKDLTKTVTCMVYAVYDATLEIDKNRNIITNF